jgi:glutathione S-transferase
MPPLLPSLVTLIALLLYLAVCINVGRARTRYGIKAPATTGDPGFERAFRVQMNMLEHLPLFLAVLWLFALFVDPAWGSAIGAAWIVGRALYAEAYGRDVAKRGPGFLIAMTAEIVLLVGALVAVLRQLF